MLQPGSLRPVVSRTDLARRWIVANGSSASPSTAFPRALRGGAVLLVLAIARPDVQASEPERARAAFAAGLASIDPVSSPALDLDAEAPDHDPSAPRSGADLRVQEGEIAPVAPRVRDDSMLQRVERLSDAPWWRTETDAGRTAWFQVLHRPRTPAELRRGHRHVPAVIRWIVASKGAGPPLATPRNARCVGSRGAIDVWFDHDEGEFASFVVERMDPASGAWRFAASSARAPWTDRGVLPGVRHHYRVSGVAAGGGVSLPVCVRGTTESSGIHAGSVRVARDSPDAPTWIDLVTGELSRAGGDLRFVSSVGGGLLLRFADSADRPLFRTFASAATTGAWPVGDPGDVSSELRPGVAYDVGLPGGGISRFRFESRTPASPGVNCAVLAYQTWLDGDAFPPAPPIRTEVVSEQHIRIRVDVPAGGSIERLELVEADRPGTPRRALTADAAWRARAECAAGRVAEVRAVCRDRLGRRMPESHACVDRRGTAPIAGTCELDRRQGFSFAALAPATPSEADFVVEGTAGGNASVSILAPEGVTTLRTAAGVQGASASQLFDAVLAVTPAPPRLRLTDDADSRNPSTDVMVVRTRSGGWAKLLVERLERGGPGVEPRIRVRYVFSPDGGEFRPGVLGGHVAGGLRLSPGVSGGR